MARGPRKAGQKADRSSGQASVMFGMMMVTFALFFAFVVNVGMLVHAKINLQNAADAAAYAGAAAQARLLNHMGYLNYEMRRQYKKFLFRYYVIGNLARPDADNTSGPRQYEFRAGSPLGAPAVCVIFNSKDNICQNSTLGAIKIPSANPLDGLQNTVVSQLQQLEAARRTNCQASALTNQLVLSSWLLNTDPSLDTLVSTISASSDLFSQAVSNGLTVTQSLAQGLGIYPREMILRERIKTLAEYVNAAPQTEVTYDVAQDLRNSIDPLKRERTIVAFESAFKSLGNHTFDDTESIVLDELLPVATDGADLLRLIPVTTTFDTYYSVFDEVNTSSGSTDPMAKDCRQDFAPITVKLPLPVGFKKATDKLVYYAIRVSADAKLLFNPFGSSLKLKAYSAAQPFGSRIGPLVIDESDFVDETGTNVLTGACGRRTGADCVNRLPNLNMLSGKTWNDFEVQSPFRDALRLETGGSIDVTALKKSYQVAMSPNKIESGRYLMIEDQNASDPFIRHFDSGNGASDPTYAFWAPIRSPEKAATEKPEDLIREVLSGVATAGSETESGSGLKSGADATEVLQTGLAEGLKTYFSKLREGLGEDGEGFNVVRLKNPFRTLASAGYTPIPLPGDLGLKDPLEAKTGWSKTRNSETWGTGRSGYSVKFVPLKMLQFEESGGGALPSTDGAGATWNNFPNLIDGEAEFDFEKIQH